MNVPARLFALLCLAALSCTPPAKDAQVTVKLLRGEVDPLSDPGTAERSGSPVGTLEVRFDSGGRTLRKTVPLSGAETLDLKIEATPGTPSELTIVGLRAADGAPYSGGRSIPFVPAISDAQTVTLYLGPLESFSALRDGLPSPRLDARVVSLGAVGALVAFGRTQDVTPPVAAEPPVVLYQRAEAALCTAASGCLTGELPSARTGAIAVSVGSRAVLGLGTLPTGVRDDALFLIEENGSSQRLTLSGDALPKLSDAAALALDLDSVLILGGRGADGAASSAVFLVDVKNRVVTRQSSLLSGRARAGVATLSTGEVLVVGGEDVSGTGLSTAELYRPGGSSRLVDGGGFSAARKLLQGPRVSPRLLRLADDGVLIAGGGTASLELFRVDLGQQVGGLVDVAVPAAFTLSDPLLVRLGKEVLLTSGEQPGATPAAFVFTADEDQVLSPASPTYRGTYRSVGAGKTRRARGDLAVLADGTLLLAGGGSAGVLADPNAANPGVAGVELFVPVPP